MFIVGGERLQPTDDKSSPKRAWSDHMNNLQFSTHQPYLWLGWHSNCASR